MKKAYIPSFQEQDNDYCVLGLHVFSGRERNFLLNGRHGTSVLVDDALLDQIRAKNLTDSLKLKLLQRGLAKSESSERRISDGVDPINPGFFLIDLTDQCQLACRYCLRTPKKECPIIDSDDLVRILSKIVEYCRRRGYTKPVIQPWGGEPLLALDRIKHAQDYLLEAGLCPQIAVESNGIGFSRELVREMVSRQWRLGISLDGPEPIHNRQRPMEDGRGSYSEVIAAIRMLQEYGETVLDHVIAVVTPETVSFDSYLRFFFDEIGLEFVKINPVKELGRRSNEIDTVWNLADVRSFWKNLAEQTVRRHKDSMKGVELNLKTRMMNLLKRSPGSVCLSRGCLGGKRMVAFSRKGMIFPCDVTDYTETALGAIQTAKGLDDVLNDFWNKHDSNPSCKNRDACPWFAYCRGGCRSASKSWPPGKHDKVDVLSCTINKAVYPVLVEYLLEDPEAAFDFAFRS